jgi:hypothetical protein
MRVQLNADSITLTAVYVLAACVLLILLLLGFMLYVNFRSKREARGEFARHVTRIKARTTTCGGVGGDGVSTKGEPTWVGEVLSAIDTGSENPTREIRIPGQVQRVVYVLRPGEHPAVLPIRPRERIDLPAQLVEKHEPRHLLP